MSGDRAPLIAVYDFAHVFHWVVENPKGARAKLLWQLHNTRVCPFCSVSMVIDPCHSGIATPDDYVVICPWCGFWFGRGTKRVSPDPDDWGAPGGRGAMGLLHARPFDDVDVPLPELLRFLAGEHRLLNRIDPFKAEELVCELFRQTFGWEVIHAGGRRDAGIDAVAIRSSKGRAIIQIKWRQNTRRAESVALVREFAGTLLARGIPNGIIVTTAERFSPDARNEIKAVSEREIVEVGRLSIEYQTYADLLAMLQITAARHSENPRVPIHLPDRNWHCLFDGNGVWDHEHRYLWDEAERRHEWVDPVKILVST